MEQLVQREEEELEVEDLTSLEVLQGEALGGVLKE